MRQLKIQETITASRTLNLNRYFNDLSNFGPISADEEVEMFKKIKSGDRVASDKIIKSNLRFVISIAKQYQFTSSKPSLTDLISAGNIGLVKAVEKFDYTKGFKFISYAVWWIRNEIILFLNLNKTIRASSDKNQKYNRIQRSIDEFTGINGRAPTNEELVELTNLSIKDINDLTTYFKQTTFPKSLYEHVGNEVDGGTIIDLIKVEDTNIEAIVETDSVSSDIRRLMNNVLSKKEITVLDLTYGFNEIGREYTPADIAEKLNISAERIRQIRVKALKKLRWHSPRIGLNIRNV